jgi:DNA modification methylase
MEIKKIKIDLIKPHEKNAKKHPRKQIEQIAASIKEFGFQQPLVVDKDGNLIVGHGRLHAAKLLKLSEVPVVVADSLTAEQVATYRLADNKLNESDWDMALVLEELKGLSDDMFDLTGFSKDLLLEKNKGDDIYPTDVDNVCNLGDLWALGRHRLYCGDSTLIDCVAELMGERKADMVFTDPPYNVDYKGANGMKIKNDKFKTNAGFYQFLYDAISNLKMFVSGDVYIAMSSSELHTLQKAFIDCGGHWSTFIIWVKDNFTLGRSNYQRQYEPILYGWFDGSTHYWSGKRNLGDVVQEDIMEEADGTYYLKINDVQTDIWKFPKPKENKVHPTMKPVALMERAIINSTLPNGLVLDPFLGSGSTLIACEKTGRTCYGLELDPKYADVIIKRWEDYTGQKAKLLSKNKNYAGKAEEKAIS